MGKDLVNPTFSVTLRSRTTDKDRQQKIEDRKSANFALTDSMLSNSTDKQEFESLVERSKGLVAYSKKVENDFKPKRTKKKRRNSFRDKTQGMTVEEQNIYLKNKLEEVQLELDRKTALLKKLQKLISNEL